MEDGVAEYVRLEVMRGRLQSIVDEAGAALARTAFSMVIREAKDFACAILLPDGRTVVQSGQSAPVFLGTMTLSAGHLLKEFPLEEWQPGDVVGTNDMWLGAGHYNDLTMLMPVYVDGAIVAFAGVVAHLPDVGGRILDSGATQCFEEGLCVPPMKIATASGIDAVLTRILKANVRLPEQVIGDLQAELNAATVISQRLSRLCREISLSRFRYVCRALEERSETFMRRAISQLPDGTYGATTRSEPVGGASFDLRLAVRVKGEELEVDFAGTSKQVPVGVNACYGYSRSYVLYALKCLLAPSMPYNEGIFRPITVVAPEASVVNSRFPAAGAARNLVGHYIPMLIFDALAPAAADRVIAESAAPLPVLSMSGAAPITESLFRIHALVPGGFGARATKDGLSCVGFPMSGSAIPIEMIEATCPLLFEERQLRPGSGGTGKFQGGLGQRVVIRCLAEWAQVAVAGQRLREPPKGLSGGGNGATARVRVNGTDIEDPSRGVKLGYGDVITIESAGGGGYGGL